MKRERKLCEYLSHDLPRCDASQQIAYRAERLKFESTEYLMCGRIEFILGNPS